MALLDHQARVVVFPNATRTRASPRGLSAATTTTLLFLHETITPNGGMDPDLCQTAAHSVDSMNVMGTRICHGTGLYQQTPTDGCLFETNYSPPDGLHSTVLSHESPADILMQCDRESRAQRSQFPIPSLSSSYAPATARRIYATRPNCMSHAMEVGHAA
jgi:hypothetical protein